MIAIGSPRFSDLGTLTSVSSEVGSFLASNIFLPQPFDRWRTSVATGFLVIDFGASGISVRMLVNGYTNATGSATIRWRASDSSGLLTSAPSFDTGVVRHWPGTADYSDWNRTHSIIFLHGPVRFRYWRLDVDNVGAANYECGRLILDDPWIPPRGMDWGSSVRYVETVRRVRALGGALYSAGRGLYREFSFSLRVTERQDPLLEQAERLERLRGGSKELFVMLDTENQNVWMDRSGYCVFQDLGPTVNLTRNLWGKSYALEERELP